MRNSFDEDVPFRMPDNYYDPPDDRPCPLCEAGMGVIEIKDQVSSIMARYGVTQKEIDSFFGGKYGGELLAGIEDEICKAVHDEGGQVCPHHQDNYQD